MAILKISDLSVGDWVRYDNGVTPYSIRSIERTGDQECVVLKDDMYPDGITGFVKYLKPIPITAETLERNGLCVVEQDANFCEYELFGSENFSLFHTKGTLRYRLETPQASVVCWFIHELQHALRLAGVDKEINL
jgi:hypothetical protein